MLTFNTLFFTFSYYNHKSGENLKKSIPIF
jgi:hypothetical protein